VGALPVACDAIAIQALSWGRIKVRLGQRVVITYRGEPIAEIRPTERGDSVETSLAAREAAGILAPAGSRKELSTR
jgi:antitoxin (DNA-binding transcriptional repressor) of toxin-antitoxin stability system